MHQKAVTMFYTYHTFLHLEVILALSEITRLFRQCQQGMIMNANINLTSC